MTTLSLQIALDDKAVRALNARRNDTPLETFCAAVLQEKISAWVNADFDQRAGPLIDAIRAADLTTQDAISAQLTQTLEQA